MKWTNAKRGKKSGKIRWNDRDKTRSVGTKIWNELKLLTIEPKLFSTVANDNA